MIRVMIVDDQRILLEGLLHLFEKTGKIEVVNPNEYSSKS